MKTLRKIEIEEVGGAWLVSTAERTQAYSQTSTKEYVRFIKDLLKHFELHNVLEIKEK